MRPSDYTTPTVSNGLPLQPARLHKQLARGAARRVGVQRVQAARRRQFDGPAFGFAIVLSSGGGLGPYELRWALRARTPGMAVTTLSSRPGKSARSVSLALAACCSTRACSA